MKKRKLGKSGLEVAPLAFGGNVFGWTVDESASFKLLDAFVDSGFNLVDTADVYSRWVPGNKGGESEAIIGKWLKASGKRDKVIIATKVGKEIGGKKGLSRKYILEAVEASLTRLRTDCIDLYQAHDDDPNTPMEETLETFTNLIKEGKVRAIGASNFTADRFAMALKVSQKNSFARYETLQPLYNLYDREPFETELEPLCIEKGVGVINFYSLAHGFLSGKYRSESDLSISPRGSGVKKYLNERGFRILAALDEVSKLYNTDPATIAIAWVISRPGITAPIASATKIEQLKQLTNATALELDSISISKLNVASAY